MLGGEGGGGERPAPRGGGLRGPGPRDFHLGRASLGEGLLVKAGYCPLSCFPSYTLCCEAGQWSSCASSAVSSYLNYDLFTRSLVNSPHLGEQTDI